ncbi:MAG: phosphotransferase family protein [Bacilli bacterium]|nr:phosphotransferase family protein [Bacilli bacterium]
MEKEEIIRKYLGKEAKIIAPLMGGMMNESYIVEHFDKKYVLYMPTAQANEMVNRYLEKENQRIVYSLKLTSKNVYFDPETGIKINEYIEGASLDHVDHIDINRVAGLLKFLHGSRELSQDDYRPFRRFINYEKEADAYIHHRGPKYKKLREALFNERDFLESQPLVLCHNDSQKSNIVAGNDGKYYLIDFEFMGNNDCIYDIAAYGNGTVKEGRELLNAYYGAPNKEEIKRYYLWRIFLSLQWHNVAIVKHHRGEGEKHGYDFMKVANFFLANAMDAYEGLIKGK